MNALIYSTARLLQVVFSILMAICAVLTFTDTEFFNLENIIPVGVLFVTMIAIVLCFAYPGDKYKWPLLITTITATHVYMKVATDNAGNPSPWPIMMVVCLLGNYMIADIMVALIRSYNFLVSLIPRPKSKYVIEPIEDDPHWDSMSAQLDPGMATTFNPYSQ